MTLSSKIASIAKTTTYNGTVLSVVNGLARIALSGGGAILSDVPLIGAANVGTTVIVAYIGGDPIAYSTGQAMVVRNPYSTSGLIEQETSGDTIVAGWYISQDGLISNTGSIRLDPNIPAVIVGAAVDYLNGIGIFLGYDDTPTAGYKMHIGDPDNQVLTWDGSNLALTGQITAESGLIGGWTIATGQLSSGSLYLDSSTPAVRAGAATTYASGTGIFLGNDSGTYRMRIGDPAAQSIKWDGSSLLIAGTIQSTNFQSGLSGWQITAAGDAELNNVVVRGEIVTSIFRYNEITATAGDLGVFKGGGVLTASATSVASPSTFNISYSGSTLAVNDIVRIKDGIKDNWCLITTVVGGGVYTLELKSGTPGTFAEGIPVINYGPSGQGGILLTANNTYAPYIDIFTHAGTPWTTITSKTRVGKLDGITDADLNPTGYGLYSDNVFLKGSIVAGAGKVILSDYGISVATGRTSDFGYIRFEDTIGSSIPVGSISIDDHAIFATYATGIGIDVTHTATQDTLQEAGEIHLSARVDSIPYWSHSNYAEMWLTAYSEPNPGGAVYFAARQGVVSRTMKLKVYGTMEADFLDLEDSTAPATPASGYGRLYVTNDNLMYKNDGGYITNVGASGNAAFMLPMFADNFIGLWSFAYADNLGTPVALDLGPFGLHLTNSNATGGPVIRNPGYLHTMDFNGTSAQCYRAITGSQIGKYNWFGFGAWVYIDDVSRSHGIAAMGTTTQSWWLLYYEPAELLEFGFYDATGTTRTITVAPLGGALTVGWHYFGCGLWWVGSGNNGMYVHLDSSYSALSNQAFGGPRAPAGNFTVGYTTRGPFYLDGKIAYAYMGSYSNDLKNDVYNHTKGYFGK